MDVTAVKQSIKGVLERPDWDDGSIGPVLVRCNLYYYKNQWPGMPLELTV